MRKISSGEGVERTFQTYSPLIAVDRGQAPRRRAPRQAVLPARALGQVGAHQRKAGLTTVRPAQPAAARAASQLPRRLGAAGRRKSWPARCPMALDPSIPQDRAGPRHRRPPAAVDAARLRAGGAAPALRRAAGVAARDHRRRAALRRPRRRRAASVLVPLVAARRRPDGAADAAHRPPAPTTRARSAFPAAAPSPATPTRSHRAARGRRRRSACRATQVEVLGSLPTYTTGTGFVVTPVVAPGAARRSRCSSIRSRSPRRSRCRSPCLMNPAHHQRHASSSAACAREFLSMPWQGTDAAGPAAPLLHLGRDRGDAAQPLPLPVAPEPARRPRHAAAKARRYHRPR